MNTALIDLYQQIGQTLSRRIESAEWGEGVVDRLAEYLARTQPGLRGFTESISSACGNSLRPTEPRRKSYRWCEKLPWTHDLLIREQSKRPEAREFYLRLATKGNWSKRELERQIKAALFERTVLTPAKGSPPVRQMGAKAISVFKDSYVLEFLDLQPGHDEAHLHRALVRKLRSFLTERGRDFCCMGSEVFIPVGGPDFALDLLFFHRGLNCRLRSN